MLGEPIFESKGKFMDHRVLSIENGVPKTEISVKGIGILKGSTEVTEIWTIGTCKDLKTLHMVKDRGY